MNKIIQASKFKDKLMVYIQGVTHTLPVNNTFTEDAMNRLFAKIRDYRMFPSDELYDEILMSVNPKNYLTKIGSEFILDGDGKLTLKGSNEPVPNVLAERIVSAYKNNEDYQYLVNFWKLAILNPNEQSKKDMFKFLERNGMVITNNGYFISYKAVATNSNLSDRDKYVAMKYIEVKKSRKDPSHYAVFDNNGSFGIRYKLASSRQPSLQEEYENLIENLDSYNLTDKHTRKMDIKLGKPVVLPETEVDNDANRPCSKGLHVGSPEYVKAFASKGDTILICLVNPMDVRAVPVHDANKMRTRQYFPIGITEFDKNRDIKPIDTDYFEDDYEEYTKDDIEEMLDNKQWTNEELKDIVRNRVMRF